MRLKEEVRELKELRVSVELNDILMKIHEDDDRTLEQAMHDNNSDYTTTISGALKLLYENYDIDDTSLRALRLKRALDNLGSTKTDNPSMKEVSGSEIMPSGLRRGSIIKYPTKSQVNNQKRIKNREWLHHSQDIALKTLNKLDDLSWSRTFLSDKLNITTGELNEILTGKRDITLKVLVGLQDILQIPILVN